MESKKFVNLLESSFKKGANYTKLVVDWGGSIGIVKGALNFTLEELNAEVSETHILLSKATADIMRIMMRKILIGEMSWKEFEENMKDNDLIIVPVGALEQHGHHNPLGTDTYIAEKAAFEVGKKTNF